MISYDDREPSVHACESFWARGGRLPLRVLCMFPTFSASQWGQIMYKLADFEQRGCVSAVHAHPQDDVRDPAQDPPPVLSQKGQNHIGLLPDDPDQSPHKSDKRQLQSDEV